MALVVRGAVMPGSCAECVCCDRDHFLCCAREENIWSFMDAGRPAWCPVVELSERVKLLSDEIMTACGFEI